KPPPPPPAPHKILRGPPAPAWSPPRTLTTTPAPAPGRAKDKTPPGAEGGDAPDRRVCGRRAPPPAPARAGPLLGARRRGGRARPAGRAAGGFSCARGAGAGSRGWGGGASLSVSAGGSGVSGGGGAGAFQAPQPGPQRGKAGSSRPARKTARHTRWRVA